jgi:hypothetical protein
LTPYESMVNISSKWLVYLFFFVFFEELLYATTWLKLPISTKRILGHSCLHIERWNLSHVYLT